MFKNHVKQNISQAVFFSHDIRIFQTVFANRQHVAEDKIEKKRYTVVIAEKKISTTKIKTGKMNWIQTNETIMFCVQESCSWTLRRWRPRARAVRAAGIPSPASSLARSCSRRIFCRWAVAVTRRIPSVRLPRPSDSGTAWRQAARRAAATILD